MALFGPLGSVTPVGGVTVAVLVRVDPKSIAASGAIVADTTNVAVAATGKIDGRVDVAGAGGCRARGAAGGRAGPRRADEPAGSESDTVAPLATDGPALVTTIVYSIGSPGTASV